jgi:hypothetical protein
VHSHPPALRGDDAIRDFDEVLNFCKPSFEDYFSILSSEGSEERERYLRLQAWHAENDLRRKSSSPNPMSEEETANIA